MSKENAAAPRLVEVILAKAHTHAGKLYAAGDKIKVTEPERDWLARKNITEKAATK